MQQVMGQGVPQQIPQQIPQQMPQAIPQGIQGMPVMPGMPQQMQPGMLLAVPYSMPIGMGMLPMVMSTTLGITLAWLNGNWSLSINMSIDALLYIYGGLSNPFRFGTLNVGLREGVIFVQFSGLWSRQTRAIHLIHHNKSKHCNICMEKSGLWSLQTVFACLSSDIIVIIHRRAMAGCSLQNSAKTMQESLAALPLKILIQSWDIWYLRISLNVLLASLRVECVSC